MVIIDGKYNLPPPLLRELDFAYECCIDHDQDFVLVIDGREGSGKSKLSRQIGYYLMMKSSYKFSLDNIHFTSQDHMDTATKHEMGWVNILDESRSSLNRKRAMSRGNVTYTNWFSECRDMNQIHILLLPAYHDLDDYVALWRCNLLIHVLKYDIRDDSKSSGRNLVLGNFVIHDIDQMQYHLQNRHKFGKYSYPKWRKEDILTFSDYEVLEDLFAYKKKKAQKREEKAATEEKQHQHTDSLYKMVALVAKHGMKRREIAEYLGVDERTIYNYLKKHKDTA